MEIRWGAITYTFFRCLRVGQAEEIDDVPVPAQILLHVLPHREGRPRRVRHNHPASEGLPGRGGAVGTSLYLFPHWTRYSSLHFPQINSGRYDTKEDFTVVLQPFMKAFNAPEEESDKFKPFIDESYITYDCFHFSQKGHALGGCLNNFPCSGYFLRRQIYLISIIKQSRHQWWTTNYPNQVHMHPW